MSLSAVSCSFNPSILLKRCCGALRLSNSREMSGIGFQPVVTPSLDRMDVEQEARESTEGAPRE